MGLLNPVTTVLPLRDSLQGRDRSGLFSATATGPVRYREEDGETGYWAEKGTTNLFQNPIPSGGTNGWSVAGAGTLSYANADGETYIAVERVSGAMGIQSATSDAPAMSSGQSISVQCQLRSPNATLALCIRVRFYDGANGSGAQVGSDALGTSKSVGADWVDFAYTAVAPASTVSARVTFLNSETGTPGDQLHMRRAQQELNGYVTSFCPQLDPLTGNPMPGYSWAGTPHASASVRSGSHISIPVAGHLDTVQGEVYLTHRELETARTTNLTMLSIGAWNSDVNDHISLHHNSTLLRFSLETDGVSSLAVQSGKFVRGDWQCMSADWSESDIAVTADDGTRVSGIRNAPPTGVPSAEIINIANEPNSNASMGLYRDLLIYDAPLSDARRAIVLDAVANDADMDELWALFEEWEAVGIASDTLELQSGEGTAGVAAIAEPMDLLQLQDGQGTAGVRGEGQAMELVELKAGVGTLPYGYPARVTWRSP